MKWIIRTFFKTLRLILGPIILIGNWITTPRGVKREESLQAEIDKITANLALYQFSTCPFCIKVRRAIKRQSLNIELKDAQRDPQHREELRTGGGDIKVPCLRITKENGDVEWMYESDVIVEYLNGIEQKVSA